MSGRIQDPEGITHHQRSNHLFIISSPENIIYEYNLSGQFLDTYDLSDIDPVPNAAQGLTFGESSYSSSAESIYIADGMADNYADGRIYEVFFPDVSLPVELVNFYATYQNNAVSLKWKTMSELNNAGWIIEKKLNIENSFSRIDFVEGAGNSAVGKEYEYFDNNINPGELYNYRISDVSFDGIVTQHQIVSADIPRLKNFVLFNNYPNPFNSNTTIMYELPESAEVLLLISDLGGRNIEKFIVDVRIKGYINFNGSE